MDDVVFVDRYTGMPGGRPTAFSYCRGCDGMGCTPVQDASADDGWRFDVCGRCGGSARCGRWEGLRRLPGWLWKGSRFVWEMGMSPQRFAPDTSWWWNVWLAWKCAFLVDLRVWDPERGWRWMR